MASHQHYCDPEKVLAELHRQQTNSDNEEEGELDFEESVSESEDEILLYSDVEDVFDCVEEDENSESDGDQNNDRDNDDDRDFELGKDEETLWTNKPLRSKFARTSSSNVITYLPGPEGDARGVTDEESLFSLFITDVMIGNIVRYTNNEMECSRLKCGDSLCYVIRPTDVVEMKALIGMLFMTGVLKDSGLGRNDMFSEAYGPPIFRCTMPQERYAFLLQNLRFDDKSTRESRKANDKFAAFREMWNTFVSHCLKYYSPSEYLTVNEQLLSFRGRCPFKMFIPSKPEKDGLRIISMCDAKTFYFISGIPYVGKEQTKNNRDLSFPTQYVLRLTESVAGSNRNVTCGNWFTSYELAEELYKKKLTVVGALRKNKREIPPPMLSAAPAGSSKFMYQDHKMLASFNPKKNKKVLLISSMHHEGIISGETSKPEIIEFYNLTKCGVDVLDKLIKDKSTKKTSRRWPLRCFFGILDIAAVNSFVLFGWNTKQDTFSVHARSTFLKNLALALTKPFMETRMNNPRISRTLRQTIAEIIGKEEELRERYTANCHIKANQNLRKKRRRCNLCDPSKDRKGNEFCAKCNSCVCGEHKTVLCVRCVNDHSSDETEM